MANPFGELVDDRKLDDMARYNGKPKSQEDRAREAWRVKDGDGYVEARKYVKEVKSFYGDGASTLCMIFNGTGDTLYYVDDHDWYGNVSRTPYPPQIGNGQWASFLHEHVTAQAVGSEAAVIYRGRSKGGQDASFILCWSTPWGPWYKNKAYCEMRDAGFSPDWDYYYNHVNNAGYEDKVDRDGILINVSTAEGSSPFYTAIITTPHSD